MIDASIKDALEFVYDSPELAKELIKWIIEAAELDYVLVPAYREAPASDWAGDMAGWNE